MLSLALLAMGVVAYNGYYSDAGQIDLEKVDFGDGESTGQVLHGHFLQMKETMLSSAGDFSLKMTLVMAARMSWSAFGRRANSLLL